MELDFSAGGAGSGAGAGAGAGAGSGSSAARAKRKRSEITGGDDTQRTDGASNGTNDAEGDAGSGGGEASGEVTSVIVQFQSLDGDKAGPQLELPIDTNPKQMSQVVNELLQNADRVPYAFYVNEEEIAESLKATVSARSLSTEIVLPIVYQPLATFRVHAVTRCTDTIQGHADAVLHVSFSPDGQMLASGGGDTLVRFYDAWTATPKNDCRGHKHHVLCTAWSPDGARFASGDKVGEIRVWNPRTGKETCKPLKGHKAWITSIAWEPMHLAAGGQCERLATSSKDGSVRIWNVRTGRQEMSLAGHAQSVECVKWGGEGLLYTASRDRTVKVWALVQGRGKLVRTLVGHAHRVNSLALSTDYVCRTGPFDHTGKIPGGKSPENALAAAKARYAEVAARGAERLVSASDDFTMFMWTPTVGKKSITRMTGHQQPVNHITFSPDGRFVASASFDKKVKLWNGLTGRLIATLDGHVAAVYQVCWSGDSRLLASASKDSTVKVWKVEKPKKAMHTLAGHYDEVYALDWSPNGQRLASGSKDRTVKIWQN